MPYEVLGAYCDIVTGAEIFELELLMNSASWPFGMAPGTITCEIPMGLQRGAAGGAGGGGGPVVTTGVSSPWDKFLDPNTKKAVRGGDSNQHLTLRNLYLDNGDPSELDESRAVCTVILHDRRVNWLERPPMGPAAYNTEYFGERVSPWELYTPHGVQGHNPRMLSHTRRTVEQILLDAFAHCGEPATFIQLRGGDGWADLSALMVEGGKRGRSRISMLSDTPPFLISYGESGVSVIDRIAGMYGLLLGVSPDTDAIGFVLESDISSKLPATKDFIEMMKANPADDPVTDASYGWDRDPLPDLLYIQGAPILYGDYWVLEPVARNPDKPDEWIPLNLSNTLEAYGVNLEIPGRQHVKQQDGETVLRLAAGLAMQEDLAPEIPAKFHPWVREWFRMWRVAQAMEVLPGPKRSDRVVEEEEPGSGRKYVRVQSPRYRWHIDSVATAGGSLIQSGGLHLWKPDTSNTTAEPHRWLPTLPITQHRVDEFNHGKPRVLGANVVRPARTVTRMGDQSAPWVDVNPLGVIPPEGPKMHELEDLGLEVAIVDPETGVIDTGEHIFGCDGRMTTRRMLVGDTMANVSLSVCVDNLIGTSMTYADLWATEEWRESGSGVVGGGGGGSGGGMPYLVLHAATRKSSHGDKRDTTSAHTHPPSRAGTPIGRGGPWVDAQATLPGIQVSLLSGIELRQLTPEPSGSRDYPMRTYTMGMPDLELRCKTPRLLTENELKGATVQPSFVRDGGWTSGQLTGTHHFQDVELVLPGRGGSSAGQFYPDSTSHYRNVRGAMEDMADRMDTAVRAYRSTVRGIRAINARFAGWHRDWLPGVAAFANHPVDSVYLEGSGDASTATMRVGANARGWRPYIGSAMERSAASIMAHRAAEGVASARMTGGGI